MKQMAFLAFRKGAAQSGEQAKPQKPRRVKPRFSLKWHMIKMLLLCWVLPVVLVIAAGAMQLHESIIDQSKERLQLSINSASQLATMRIDAALDASRAASYIGTVREAWSAYQNSTDKMRLYETTRLFLEQQYQYDEKFSSTILFFTDFPDEPIYVINGAAGGTDRVRTDAGEIIEQAQSLSTELGTGVAFFSVGERVFMMRNLVDSRYEPIAVLMMELNTDLLFAEFSQIANIEISAALVSDVLVEIDTLSPPELDAEPRTISALDIGAQTEDGTVITYEDGSMYASVYTTKQDYTLAYYAIYYPTILREQWTVTSSMLAAVVLFMLPLGALVLLFFMRNVTHPLRAIMKLTNEIRAEHYGIQLPESALRSHEIGTLGDNFNSMSLTLQQQFEHIYKEELALRDARIMALQSQINPHFLNNTLEIINWEARMQGDLKVCNMLESLSTMLSAAMDRRNRPMVSLSEELMYVDAYLYIINERLGKRLVFEKDIPDAFLDCRVPRLILQPILENAVNHGITPVQQGRIALRVEQEGEWLMLCVENDGCLSDEDYARIQLVLSDDYTPDSLSSGSLGLRNVHQRLRILYGEESGILVDLAKTGLTVFKLKVKMS